APKVSMSPQNIAAIMNVFLVSGVLFLVVGGVAAWLVHNPPAAYTRPGVVAAAAAQGQDFAPSEALRTPQFYALWFMLFLNITAGILFISNAVPIMRELTGAPPATALSIYGFIAIFNRLSHFFWGSVS